MDEEIGTSQARRDLSVSLNKLGHIAEVKEDIEAAEVYYKQAYKIFKELAQKTGTVDAFGGFCVSCLRMAFVSKSQEELAYL